MEELGLFHETLEKRTLDLLNAKKCDVILSPLQSRKPKLTSDLIHLFQTNG